MASWQRDRTKGVYVSAPILNEIKPTPLSRREVFYLLKSSSTLLVRLCRKREGDHIHSASPTSRSRTVRASPAMISNGDDPLSRPAEPEEPLDAPPPYESVVLDQGAAEAATEAVRHSLAARLILYVPFMLQPQAHAGLPARRLGRVSWRRRQLPGLDTMASPSIPPSASRSWTRSSRAMA